MRVNREQLRLLLIGSTVVAAALSVVVGVPRARAWMTPRLGRVWVASAALGDRAATIAPRDELEGTPVTLYAIVEARPFPGREPVLYGSVDSVVMEPGAAAVPVQEWRAWWYPLEFLWFKIEPALAFGNEEFAADYVAARIPYTQSYQVSWGLGWRHAAEVRPTADAYPSWSTGTMRFAIQAVIRDARERILQRAESPGTENVAEGDPRRAPHRLTMRGGDDAFGRILGYAGLPYVPLVGDPAEREHAVAAYLGGTVLDFWLAAARAAGEYEGPLVGWESLPEVAEVVVQEMFLARDDGAYYYSDDPRRRVSWRDVRAGDLLAIEDHVGVLYEDRGPGGGDDGILNRWDRALDAYFEPLGDSALGDAFVSGITVYRIRGAAGAE